MKIISGGQTGVDRAALDAAINTNTSNGGWCPAGRKAENGIIPSEYNLTETPSEQYIQRTEWNVRDSDATLIITQGTPTGGTAYTIEIAKKLDKPLLVVDSDNTKAVKQITDWLKDQKPNTLNLAGPRESTCPGIYEKTLILLQEILIHEE